MSRQLALGALGVFYDVELFLNDHVARDREFRTLISGLSDLEIPIRIYEFAGGASWPEDDQLGRHILTSDHLLNVLDSVTGYE